jgi:hypothetical protein
VILKRQNDEADPGWLSYEQSNILPAAGYESYIIYQAQWTRCRLPSSQKLFAFCVKEKSHD